MVEGPGGLLPFDRRHGPGEWRAIRIRLKLAVLAANFQRALRTLGPDLGQVLIVGTGSGMIETRDGDRHALIPGDIVWAAPGEEHWHGAAPGSFMAHTAISLGATQWLEEVAGHRYEKAFEDK